MDATGLAFLGAGLGAGLAIIGGGAGIGRLAASAMEGIARQQPQAILFDILFTDPDALRPEAELAFESCGYSDDKTYLHIVSESDVEAF